MQRLLLLIGLLALLPCTNLEARDKEVVVYTSVDRLFSGPILKEFESRTRIKVRVIFDTEETKSTGVLNRLLAERNNPQADVFWSGDPVRPLVLEEKDMLEPYVSGSAGGIPERYKDKGGYWTGFSARARVILYNTGLVKAEEAPGSIYDLLSPRWKGQVAIANPLFGTTSIHVAALFSLLGDNEAEKLLEALKANGIEIVSSNGEVRRLVSRGELKAGLADTDDAYTAILEARPVGMVYPDQDTFGTLVMPNMVCMIKGGPNPENARRFVDFLLSEEVEQRLAQAECAQMPLRPNLAVPRGLSPLKDIKDMSLDYHDIAQKLEQITPYLRRWAGF